MNDMDNSKFDILYIKEQLSIKKHIVITGPIGSGKSTLLKELRLSLGLKEDTPGIVKLSFWMEIYIFNISAIFNLDFSFINN